MLLHPFGKERLLSSAFFVAEIAGDESAANGQPGVGGEDHVAAAAAAAQSDEPCNSISKASRAVVSIAPERSRVIGAAGDAHPGIDLVLDAVVIRRTKKQLAHGTENLLADLGPAQALGEFPQKWFHVRDEADGLQRLSLHRSFHG